jgi:hypothetical protein
LTNNQKYFIVLIDVRKGGFMNFITIQNQVGEVMAINAERITSICYGINKSVLIYLGAQTVHTKFTNLKSAIEYVEKAVTSPIDWMGIP